MISRLKNVLNIFTAFSFWNKLNERKRKKNTSTPLNLKIFQYFIKKHELIKKKLYYNKTIFHLTDDKYF